VDGEGIVVGASKVTVKPAPLIVPKVELPLVKPLTVHVTPVLVVPVTAAVKSKVELTDRLCGVLGVLMETTTPAETVTLSDADWLASATLVTTMLNVAVEGTAAGAVYITVNPEPKMVPYVELPFAMPLTVQVTARFLVFITAAVIARVPFTGTVCALVGLVMVTSTDFPPALLPQCAATSNRHKLARTDTARPRLSFIAPAPVKS
jgi:hypothetical protein